MRWKAKIDDATRKSQQYKGGDSSPGAPLHQPTKTAKLPSSATKAAVQEQRLRMRQSLERDAHTPTTDTSTSIQAPPANVFAKMIANDAVGKVVVSGASGPEQLTYAGVPAKLPTTDNGMDDDPLFALFGFSEGEGDCDSDGSALSV